MGGAEAVHLLEETRSMTHRNSPLTPAGRLRLVQRVENDGREAPWVPFRFSLLRLGTEPRALQWLAISQTGLAVGAALITWRTGGLEIAILLHALNNVLSQLYAQVLHSELLTQAVEPTILLTLVLTAAATTLVFLGPRRPSCQS